MNKEELIQLKEKLERENRRYVPFGLHLTLTGGTSGEYLNKSYRLGEIKAKKETNQSISAITNNFEAIITYLAKKKIVYDEIDLIMFFSVFAENNGSIDIKSDKLIKGTRILDDFAVLNIYGYDVKNGAEVIDVPAQEVKGYNSTYGGFVINFSEFVQKLNEQGFALSGISNFQELKNRVINEKNTEWPIIFSFMKKNNKTL